MKQHILHIILLVLFPLWYFTNEIYPILTISNTTTLIYYILVYSLVGILFYGLFQFQLKQSNKAWLLAQILLFFLLMFGATKDLLKSIHPFLNKYAIIFPLWIVFNVFLFVKVYRSNKSFIKFKKFFTTCMLLFLGLTIVRVIQTVKIEIKSENIYKTIPSSDTLPNLYIFVFDELSNLEALEGLGHQSDYFRDSLRQIGIKYIPHAYSYSDATPISVTSILNANVIDMSSISVPLDNFSKYKVWYQYKGSYIPSYLKQLGYTSSYYGIIGLDSIENLTQFNFLDRLGEKLIEQNTFIGRINNEVSWNFIRYNIPILKKQVLAREDNMRKEFFNNDSMNLVSLKENLKSNKEKNKQFILAHFYFPHYPFNKDSLGNYRAFESLEKDIKENQNLYIEQVKFTQKTILEIGKILKETQQPSIAIFLGDHGYRSSSDSSNALKSFLAYYSNIPLELKDSSSAVNLMRKILNEHFDYQLQEDNSLPKLLYY